MRVTLLCTYFPPFNATGARRPYFLARALREAGHQVTVLTTAVEAEDRWDADLYGLRIERLPAAPVQPAMGLLARAAVHFEQASAGRPWHRPMRLLNDLLLPIDHRTRWTADAAAIEALIGPSDLVVATVPDWFLADLGSAYARRTGACFVIDYRDPWTVAMPGIHMEIVTGHGKGLAGLLRTRRFKRTERRLGQQAYALTSVSKAVLANAQRITGNPHGATFMGGFEALPSASPHQRPERFTLVYTGRLYPEQDWPAVIAALDLLLEQDPRLSDIFRLQLVGPISTDQDLLAMIHKHARDRGVIELLPRTDRIHALELQHAASALLHLSYRDRVGYIPVKFLEYQGAGRPVVLFSREDDEMEAIMRQTRTGPIIADSLALRDLLKERIAAHRAGATWEVRPDAAALRDLDYGHRMRELVRQLERWQAAYTDDRAGT